MADTRQAALYTLLKQIRPIDVSTFSNRLVLQKSTYLVQLFGFDLKYRFNWYKRGPYSPTLAIDLYAIASATPEELAIADPYKRALNDWRRLIGGTPLGMTDADWLELLSSIHYLKHISKPKPDITQANIHELLLHVEKHNFSAEQAAVAWRALDEAGLIERIDLSQ